jgi:putative DNA primase/helicase
MCAGIDRYRFDDKNGRGTFICSHCGSGDGFKLLQGVLGLSFSQAATQVDQVVGSVPILSRAAPRSTESKILALRTVWSNSKVVSRGDPVWNYLNRRLGIEKVPTDLRFHPGLQYFDEVGQLGVFPAMVAMLRYPDGSAASIHRTYLTESGDKAAVPNVKKIMSGKPLNTASVRLSNVCGCLGISEGIETAIAASERFGIPVWAATNSTLLEAWLPPRGVERVIIAGDNDAGASWAGQAAAYNLAKRLARDGISVQVEIPSAPQSDFADISITSASIKHPRNHQ